MVFTQSEAHIEQNMLNLPQVKVCSFYLNMSFPRTSPLSYSWGQTFSLSVSQARQFWFRVTTPSLALRHLDTGRNYTINSVKLLANYLAVLEMG